MEAAGWSSQSPPSNGNSSDLSSRVVWNPLGQSGSGVVRGGQESCPTNYSANFKIIPVSVATHSEPSPAARNMARTAVAR